MGVEVADRKRDHAVTARADGGVAGGYRIEVRAELVAGNVFGVDLPRLDAGCGAVQLDLDGLGVGAVLELELERGGVRSLRDVIGGGRLGGGDPPSLEGPGRAGEQGQIEIRPDDGRRCGAGGQIAGERHGSERGIGRIQRAVDRECPGVVTRRVGGQAQRVARADGEIRGGEQVGGCPRNRPALDEGSVLETGRQGLGAAIGRQGHVGEPAVVDAGFQRDRLAADGEPRLGDIAGDALDACRRNRAGGGRVDAVGLSEARFNPVGDAVRRGGVGTARSDDPQAVDPDVAAFRNIADGDGGAVGSGGKRGQQGENAGGLALVVAQREGSDVPPLGIG